MKQYNVAVLGATGIIGQQFCRILADHPMFNLSHAYASSRSEGNTISKIWQLPFFDCPSSIQQLEIETLEKVEEDVDIVFSALPKSVASQFEADLRQQGKFVFSNAGSHRMDNDVPILIPEINGDHLGLLDAQRDRYQTDGFIITNSNCSAAGAAVYLAELTKLQPVAHAVITTYQALSGAGIGGVSAMDISGNVIPYIGNEEPKIIEETRKMTGSLNGDHIENHPMDVVANAARVNVVDGHLEAITAFFNEEPDNLETRLAQVTSPLDPSHHYIAPSSHLKVLSQPDRPQPKLDVFRSESKQSQGMVVHAGRLRQQHQSLSAYVLVHNTIRGGAGGSVLNAEYAIAKGYI